MTEGWIWLHFYSHIRAVREKIRGNIADIPSDLMYFFKLLMDTLSSYITFGIIIIIIESIDKILLTLNQYIYLVETLVIKLMFWVGPQKQVNQSFFPFLASGFGHLANQFGYLWPLDNRTVLLVTSFTIFIPTSHVFYLQHQPDSCNFFLTHLLVGF